jgi:uncharacterized protein YjiS (DUF1127 family)
MRAILRQILQQQQVEPLTIGSADERLLRDIGINPEELRERNRPLGSHLLWSPWRDAQK